MKPIIYEIRRVLTSKSALIMLSLMIVIPALIAVSAASGNSNVSVFVSSEAYGWGSNGTYNVTVLLYNNYGFPVSGSKVTYFIGNNNTSVETNSLGFANTTFSRVTDQELGITSPNQTEGGITYSYSGQNSPGSGGGYFKIQVYQNQTDPYFTNTSLKEYGPSGSTNLTFSYSRYSFSTFSVQNSPQLNGLLLFYNAADVKNAPPVYLYYRAMPNSTSQFTGTGTVIYTNGQQKTGPGFPANYNESQMKLYSVYTSSPLIDIVPYNLTKHTNTTSYVFELFDSNGTELAWVETQLLNTYSVAGVNQIFFLSDLPILSFFVPLIATVSAYQTFGKDRATGALASVIVRPISRRALMTSRFVSNIVSVTIASALALGVTSLIYEHYLGIYIPSSTLILALWSLLVMTGAFVGIVYLASMFLKSSGQIIGVAIGLFVVLVLLWVFPLPLIPLIISSVIIRQPVGTLAYASSIIKLDYISPAGFSSLTDYLSGSTVSGLFFIGGTYTAAQLGITLFSVVAVGLAWIVIPFLLALVRFTRGD